MHKRILLALACTLVPTLLLAAPKNQAGRKFTVCKFTKKRLTDKFWAEGAHYGDFNKDGKTDVVIGPFWYEGPDFERRHEYYSATNSFTVKGADGITRTLPGFTGELSGRNGYSDNFLTYTYDFNGDGWIDILVFGWPGKETVWYENPKNQGKGQWKGHVVWDETDNESPQLKDITGDGRPELLCHARGFLGYVELDWKNPSKPGQLRKISHFDKQRYFRYKHGYGAGDINGDGLIDIVERDGWWEHPGNWDHESQWKFHAVPFAGEKDRGGAQMLVYDFDQDGYNDVLTSLNGHGWGLSLFKQVRDGVIIYFEEQPILGSTPADNEYGVVFSQIHALDLADIDQDGLMDVVAGKRFWAHGPGKDDDPDGPAVVYWFKTGKQRGDATFTPFRIDDNSGVGTQVTAGDINGDGYPDVVVGNKKGAFVFTNHPRKVGRKDYESALPQAR